MPWSKKSKTPLQKETIEIVTPDGEQIMVGSTESDVILIEQGFDYYISKPKITIPEQS